MSSSAQIPDMKGVAVLPSQQQLGIDATLDHLGRAPFAGDERVPTQMPPEVVGQKLWAAVELPLSADVERFRIEYEDPARPITLGRPDGIHVDPIRSAMRGVRPRIARTFGHLVGLDHLDNAGLLRFLGVDDVNARGSQPGDDEVAALDVRMWRVRAETR